MAIPGSHAPSSTTRAIPVRSLLADGALPFRLELVAGESGLDRTIGHPRIQKPGLALVGHFQGVEHDRIQVLGRTEISFLETMDDARRRIACLDFFKPGFACAVVTSGEPAPPELIEGAERARCALFKSPVKSSSTINAFHAFLDEQLAPRTRIHGVFIDVFGVGILLLGKSGIGKSECALELVQRGHRLVADDVVDAAMRPPDFVYGAATDLLKNHLEVRGLGVLNIKDLFGVASVRDRKRIDLVIRLLGRDEEDAWDRLGIDEEWYEILGVKIPLKRLPVRPGKNTASTVEVAARNELLRQAGHHSAREFHARLAAALGIPDPALLEPGAADVVVPAPPRMPSQTPPPSAMSSPPPPAIEGRGHGGDDGEGSGHGR
jgi:HPr kinase/phosphorylase